ncbi:uncharacterized protein involved in response to NO [Thiohalobacter thiocyanaticus]|uniref:Uncharacterized protein involved in response to NO n=1 Tax=Thiohalobacter thiocyanaticus TaxID=585455 RepID=A0A1Z4VN01_9GAMM|nr:NnrS family protein [Thiohalobacter thiocyanaticus]BAZ92883.1 uncharacterized protein involved in response to NO [Thiohalobacter thiocyanaticus]
MALTQLHDHSRDTRQPVYAPFALGFRPFFLAAGLAGLALMALWLGIWTGVLTPAPYFDVINWHAHEMLFGYTAAVIAGFLLTAVRNWSGVDTLNGAPLAALAGLWLLGRTLFFVPALPAWTIAAVDLVFLPALALSLAGPIFASPNKANRVLLLLLGVMFTANALMHLQALGLTATTARPGILLMLDTVLLLILMITGRVLPFFTEAVLACSECRRSRLIELATFATLLGMLAADVGGWPRAAGVMALAAALVQLVRVAGWIKPGIGSLPILLVLYVAYAWVVVGLLLKGLADLGLLAPNLALHALTIGVIGGFTLGMMARVALGHTGRMMQSARLTNLGFVLLNLGALVRIFPPLLLPEQYSLWVVLSGLLWIGAFAAFVWVYAPVLVRTRVDGKPG